VRSEFHGIASLGLILFAIVTAAAAAFLTWWLLGVSYLAICAVCLAAILYAFCAKCPCQAHCSHVIPGKLAVLWSREPGPYSKLETAVVAVTLLLILGIPQLWLWRYLALMAAFWVAAAVALMEIRAYVCRACDNAFCPASLSSAEAIDS
jgi:hypothetical protein